MVPLGQGAPARWADTLRADSGAQPATISFLFFTVSGSRHRSSLTAKALAVGTLWRMESPLIHPLSRADLNAEWMQAEEAALTAEHDWLVVYRAHQRLGGTPPPTSVLETAERLRRTADAIKRSLPR